MEKSAKFKQMTYDLSNQLCQIHYEGDLSDLGNEIGIVIGNNQKSPTALSLRQSVKVALSSQVHNTQTISTDIEINNISSTIRNMMPNNRILLLFFDFIKHTIAIAEP